VDIDPIQKLCPPVPKSPSPNKECESTRISAPIFLFAFQRSYVLEKIVAIQLSEEKCIKE
jgi:hypothetical protein